MEAALDLYFTYKNGGENTDDYIVFLQKSNYFKKKKKKIHNHWDKERDLSGICTHLWLSNCDFIHNMEHDRVLRNLLVRNKDKSGVLTRKWIQMFHHFPFMFQPRWKLKIPRQNMFIFKQHSSRISGTHSLWDRKKGKISLPSSWGSDRLQVALNQTYTHTAWTAKELLCVQ